MPSQPGHKWSRFRLPVQLTDEVAKQLLPACGGVEDLRRQMLEAQSAISAVETANRVNEALTLAVSGIVDVDVPESMIQEVATNEYQAQLLEMQARVSLQMCLISFLTYCPRQAEGKALTAVDPALLSAKRPSSHHFRLIPVSAESLHYILSRGRLLCQSTMICGRPYIRRRRVLHLLKAYSPAGRGGCASFG